MKCKHITLIEAQTILDAGHSENYSKVTTQNKNSYIYGYGSSDVVVKDTNKDYFLFRIKEPVNFNDKTTVLTDAYKDDDSMVTLYPVTKKSKRVTYYE